MEASLDENDKEMDPVAAGYSYTAAFSLSSVYVSIH
jgi:hypothetical protein